MKLNAELNHESHIINIKQEGAKVFAEIDGRKYEIEARELDQDTFLFNVGGRVFECRVEGSDKRREQFHVQVGSQTFNINLCDPKRLRGAQHAAGHAEGVAEIIAPMPGKVVRVLVQSGDEVKIGEGVIIVEAMKMQNEMKSPKDGVVKEIRVQAGDTVNGGDVLAVIE
jgi:biotin carboxyl carrier protein